MDLRRARQASPNDRRSTVHRSLAPDRVDPVNIVTVTESVPRRCGWCHRPLEVRPGAGRPARYCSPSLRQRAYEARQRADALHVPSGQTIVAESDLRLLHDRLYQLESAIEDVRTDMAGRPSAHDCRNALEHLLEAANDLVGMVVEPVRG
jgi:hypothetical protein